MVKNGWYRDREKNKICMVENGRALTPDSGRWYTPDPKNLEGVDLKEYRKSIETRKAALENEEPQEYPNSIPLKKAALEREAEFIERMSKHTGESQSLPKCTSVAGVPFKAPIIQGERYIGSSAKGLRKHITRG